MKCREQAKAVPLLFVACILSAHNSVSASNACLVMVVAVVVCVHFQCDFESAVNAMIVAL